MRLKSITLKGFKSFPDRTRLDFGPGVSVVVGPNGSGKSNVTDAVLWAMGEQSPLAVQGPVDAGRDLRWGAGACRRAARPKWRSCSTTLTAPWRCRSSEISIVRRLNRSGEGEISAERRPLPLDGRDRGAVRHGLGKETHSIISQGRVEAIVTSRPREQAPADRGGRGARQASQAPAPRAAEARADAGESRPRARRGARGAHAAAPAQAPGRSGGAARAAGAPDAGGALGAGARRGAGPGAWSWGSRGARRGARERHARSSSRACRRCATARAGRARAGRARGAPR